MSIPTESSIEKLISWRFKLEDLQTLCNNFAASHSKTEIKLTSLQRLNLHASKPSFVPPPVKEMLEALKIHPAKIALLLSSRLIPLTTEKQPLSVQRDLFIHQLRNLLQLKRDDPAYHWLDREASKLLPRERMNVLNPDFWSERKIKILKDILKVILDSGEEREDEIKMFKKNNENFIQDLYSVLISIAARQMDSPLAIEILGLLSLLKEIEPLKGLMIFGDDHLEQVNEILKIMEFNNQKVVGMFNQNITPENIKEFEEITSRATRLYLENGFYCSEFFTTVKKITSLRTIEHLNLYAIPLHHSEEQFGSQLKGIQELSGFGRIAQSISFRLSNSMAHVQDLTLCLGKQSVEKDPFKWLIKSPSFTNSIKSLNLRLINYKFSDLQPLKLSNFDSLDELYLEPANVLGEFEWDKPESTIYNNNDGFISLRIKKMTLKFEQDRVGGDEDLFPIIERVLEGCLKMPSLEPIFIT